MVDGDTDKAGTECRTDSGTSTRGGWAAVGPYISRHRGRPGSVPIIARRLVVMAARGTVCGVVLYLCAFAACIHPMLPNLWGARAGSRWTD